MTTMKYSIWKNLPILGKTREAEEEMNNLDIYSIQLEDLLSRSFPCPRSKRKKGIYEQCLHWKGKLLKVVLEEMISASNNKYFRVRHVGVIGFKKERFR